MDAEQAVVNGDISKETKELLESLLKQIEAAGCSAFLYLLDKDGRRHAAMGARMANRQDVDHVGITLYTMAESAGVDFTDKVVVSPDVTFH